MKLNINLLSPERKERLKFIQSAHLAFKIGLNGVFALLIFYLFLFSYRYSVREQNKVFQKEWDRLEKTDDYLTIEKNKKLVNDFSSFADKLEKNFSVEFLHWQVLDRVDSFLPEKAFLKEISIGEGQVVIKGRCASREDFLLLKEKMEKDDFFSEVQSPLSNFTSSQNVDFELTAKIKKTGGASG